MRTQRIGAALLFLSVLLLSVGCGAPASVESRDPAARTVVMTYQTTADSRLDGLDRVMDEINAITRREIGAEAEPKLVDAVASVFEYPLWLSQGERIDLMVLTYQDISEYIRNGWLLPLDGLLETSGKDITHLMESVELTAGAVEGGKVYGLRLPSDNEATGGGLWIPLRYLREADFPYDETRIYSMEELDSLFAALKARYPDSYPLGQITAEENFSSFGFFYGATDAVSDSVDSGVLAKDGKTLVNFYEREQYGEFLSWMRAWYEAGYIYPDAAFTSLSSSELLREGKVLSIPLTSIPGIYTDDLVGEALVCLRLSPVYASPHQSSTGTFWVIPATSADPETAMAFLNLMYTDERIINLLAWGVEGQDYVFLDAEKGVIAYPEGVTPQTADYNNPLGLYGDTRRSYLLNSDTLRQQRSAYVEEARQTGMEYAGFQFDASGVALERARVQQVLHRYLPVVESGSLELTEAYDSLLAALKEAGMDTIIAEKQRQLDAWISAH